VLVGGCRIWRENLRLVFLFWENAAAKGPVLAGDDVLPLPAMTDARKVERYYGVACVAMTGLFWVVLWLPAPKVDSALRSLPLLGPLSWIEVWLIAALGMGVAASLRRWQWWIAAPCFTLATAVFFFTRILA